MLSSAAINASVAQNPDCDCPEHPGRLTVKKTEAFDVIFLGRPDSLISCDPKSRKGRRFFTILRLYKGKNIPPRILVEYPCAGACRFEFHTEEPWLLFARRHTAAQDFLVAADPCERNRPLPHHPSEDVYTLYNDMTFTEETVFMRRHLLPAFLLPDTALARLARTGKVKAIDQNRSIVFATDLQKLILLLLSLVVFVALWFITRRWFRNP